MSPAFFTTNSIWEALYLKLSAPENILYWHFLSSLCAENHIIQRRSRTPTWKPSLRVNVVLMPQATWGNMGAVSSVFATCYSEFSTLLFNSFLVGDSREYLWGLTPKWYFQVLSLGIWKWKLFGNKVFADIIKLGILNKVILNLGLALNLMILWEKKIWHTQRKRPCEDGSRGAFLVIQWLRICLLMQGIHVQSLVKELRSHKPQATKPICCNCWGLVP